MNTRKRVQPYRIWPHGGADMPKIQKHFLAMPMSLLQPLTAPTLRAFLTFKL